MALGAALQAVVVATTAEETADDKAGILIPAVVAAVIKDLSQTTALTPNQQNHVAAMLAEVADNVSDFGTAITVS